MELRITDLSKPQKVEITHNGQSFSPPVFMYALAFDSKAGAKVKAGLFREVMQLREKGEDVTPDVIEGLTISAVASLLTGWDGVKNEKGEELPFTLETAVSVFTNYPFIFDQINSFCGKLGNFLKA